MKDGSVQFTGSCAPEAPVPATMYRRPEADRVAEAIHATFTVP